MSSFDNPVIADYFKLGLESLVAGYSIETVEEQLYYYETKEEYLKCAGIKLALDFARFNTLVSVAKQVQEINEKELW
jgi:hypothetical protein